jgi:hypothetical protein
VPFLERRGPLENFYMNVTNRGKRVKASARFQDQADARSACSSLNDEPMDVFGKGKLTVTLFYSARVKLPTAVYVAWKDRIEEESHAWKDQHLLFHTYSGPLSTVLKVEGDNPDAVAKAQKLLGKVADGVVVSRNGETLRGPALYVIRRRGLRLCKFVAEKENVVIRMVRSKRQILLFAPPQNAEPFTSIV